jgi:hypothetical protein
MTTISIQEFAQSKGFVQINKAVAVNTNGYPFLTFINKDNVAENVYFSKGSSAEVGAGQVVDKDFLSNYEIAETINVDKEVRTKLVRKGGNRLSLLDLFA